LISVWIFFAAILVIKIAAKKIHTEINDYELLVPRLSLWGRVGVGSYLAAL